MSNFPKGLRAVGFHVSTRDLLKPGGKVKEEIKSIGCVRVSRKGAVVILEELLPGVMVDLF